ncbi:MAG: NAD-dependent epimerase/dehydratase family protein [Candidatus Omnitrophota bacterium]
MSRFLVTGGAGFIGSHIVDALVRRGHYVRVLDNLSSGRISNLKDSKDKIDLVKGDICVPEDCRRASRDTDFVLHQAALRSVPCSFRNPAAYNRVNIGGTLNMLEAARVNKVKRFVFASSSSVYGQVKKFPVKEDFVLAPISPYALTKLAGEHYCRMFSMHSGLPTVILRYFNVFGPRQPFDDEYSAVIPKFINCLLHSRRPPVFGNGLQSRDFTFVENVVEANMLAVKFPRRGCGIFNIAGGRDITVLNLVSTLNRILKKHIRPEFKKKRAGDIFRMSADISNSLKSLKFAPAVDFLNGLRITIDYWRSHA